MRSNQEEREALEARRIRFREEVTQAAKTTADFSRFDQGDIGWAFSPEEIEELRVMRDQTHERIDRARALREQNRAVSDLTAQVLKEWDEAAEEERRERAVAEARKRLGL